MNRRDIKFASKDRGLRDDVRTLGALVGEVIIEQEGEQLFKRVETIRRTAIGRREGKARAARQLEKNVRGLDAETAGELVRAFSTYFQAVNLAERVHRIRRRRDYERRSDAPQPEGIHDALLKLKHSGVDAQQLQSLLAQMIIEPVFTAHPTESTRRTLLEKQQHIARTLITRLNPKRTPSEEASSLASVRMDLTAGWQTEAYPDARMTVANEREHVLFYLTDVIYRALPVFYEVLEEAIEAVFGSKPELPVLIRFGSWVGGDMDGNPNVGAETIRETLKEHRAMILARYGDELQQLHRQLSQSLDRVNISAALQAHLQDYQQRYPAIAKTIRPRHQGMPYRNLLVFMQARLSDVETAGENAYSSAAELQQDLQIMADSLARNQGGHAGLFSIKRMQHRVAAFGFHLATLDTRQDALVHRQAVGNLLGETGWEERSQEERAKRLRTALENNEQAVKQANEDEQKVLAVFSAIAEGRQRYGARAIGPYIISMAQHAEDVLAVLLLARWGGLDTETGSGVRDSGFGAPGTGFGIRGSGSGEEGEEKEAPLLQPSPGTCRMDSRLRGNDEKGSASTAMFPGPRSPNPEFRTPIPLDVAPLFETVGDLQSSADTMQNLFADPVYRAHVKQRGDQQMLMVGYSDSSKDGGLAASRWAVQCAQTALVKAGDEAGVALTLFHGRGGSTSRGGGKTQTAVLAAPPGAVRGRLRLTEQGEIINTKYGLRAIALRTLEQMCGAVLLASSGETGFGVRGSGSGKESNIRLVNDQHWHSVMDTIASQSRKAFRDLVYAPDDFVAFFRQATPVDVIERMRIGSRPASRRAKTGIEDLRAIPWVFSWTQTRSILPGWFGLGAGLAAARREHGVETLHAMLDWPFFAAMLDDAEMTLAKADIAIAEQYAALAEPALRRHFEVIKTEYNNTVSAILELRDTDTLLAHDPVLQRSIRLRNPYVDPMSLMQVDLLARWRANGSQDDELLQALFATVNGIALGLQNTG